MDHKKLWKILEELGTPDHLTCLLKILYGGQEATVRTRHGTTERFQIGKGVCQASVLSSCLFNLYAEYILWNARLDEAQARIKVARRTINNLINADDTTLMAESEEELKSLLIKVREEWKSLFKTQHSKNEEYGIWSHHFMTNRWGNNGNRDFIFLGSKITADSACSHEIKRCLLLGRKAMTNLFTVRERLSAGFLRAASHKSSVPYQFLATGTSGMACHSQDWGHRMKHMHESPSVNILLRTKLLSLDSLSWDMDCLLTL